MPDIIIEIPYNSYIKYEVESNIKYGQETNNLIRCDRILNTSMNYPGNYGYVPNTLAGDGDPLDVLLICDYPLYPGIIIDVKFIGVLLTKDEKGDDEKMIAVPTKKVDPNYENINDITDLQTNIKTKIFHFFEHYKDTEPDKWVQVKNFENKNFALKVLENSIKNFKENISCSPSIIKRL